MNNDEKVRTAINKMHNAVSVVRKKQAEQQEMEARLAEEMQKAEGDVHDAREELKRVLKAVYGKNQQPVLHRNGENVYQFMLDIDEHEHEILRVQQVAGRFLE